MAFYTSVEFYVMAAVAAAAVVGLCIKPSGRGAAKQYLLAGKLIYDEPSDSPAIDLEVMDDGKVVLTRRGLGGAVHAEGALSLAVEVAGFNITVKERLVAGRHDDMSVDPSAARFTLDFLGRERYHLKYISDHMGAMAATPLHVRPGIRVSRRIE